MEKYKELKYNDKTYTQKYQIEQILVDEGFAWFIEAETYNARIEILNKTLIFNGGTWFNGVWKFGAFRGGEWKSGTFEDGVIFNIVWKDGIMKNGIIFNGTFINGQFFDIKLRTTNQDGTKTRQSFINCEMSSNIKTV